MAGENNEIALINVVTNIKNEQIVLGKVHGREEIYKIIDGTPHQLERDGKKYKWVPTILDPNRLKRFRTISAEFLIEEYLKRSQKV